MARLPRKIWIAYAVIAVVLLILPLVLGQSFGRAWVRTLDLALLYVMLALGLNVVIGYAGLLDLGYIAFYAVGAYLYAILASPHFDLHWPFWVLLPMGAGLAAVFGVLLGAPTLKLRGDYLAIVTLGFGEIVRIFMVNLSKPPINLTNGPMGINLVDPVRLGDVSLAKNSQLAALDFAGVHKYYYLFLLLALAIVFVSIRLEDSRIGRAWMAIREDEIAAKAMGINTRNVKLLAFAMGASFGGVAGGLFAGFQGFISPESFTLWESILVLCMVVLGGMGHIPGVVLGALLLVVFPEALRHTVVPVQMALLGEVKVSPEVLRMLLFGVGLIVVMRWRPAGLWPSAAHRREFANAA
jgi:branched-chain amino acid transport system permease protein